MKYPSISGLAQISVLALGGALLVLASVLQIMKSRDKERSRSGDTFSQDHSGSGDNIMNIRKGD